MYTFSNGDVATKARLDQNIGPTTLMGVTKITPVANTPTSVTVRFTVPFSSIPRVIATPVSVVSGSTVKGVGVISVSTTGFTVTVYRTNTTNTYVAWQAWLAPTLFTTGSPVTHQLLNQGAGAMTAQCGSVSITPTSANSPKSATVTFPTEFASVPTVMTTSVANDPGSGTKGTAATEIETDGCKVWLTRGDTTATTVNWVALGRL